MGKAFAEANPNARAVFQEVDDVLEQHLSRLMFDGPDDELTLTANAQPAIMALSLAIQRLLEREAGVRLADKAVFVAGHSLGEYSALAAAGAFSLADTARLLRRRGDAMQAAVAPGEGAMAAVLALEIEVVREIAAEAAGDQVCAIANDNAPGQVVVSGHQAAVARAVELAKARGARRSILLPVSAPFHCSLMQPAADAMAQALAEAAIAAPVVPVYANVTAAAVSAPAKIRALLVQQVTDTVRWRESVLAMAAAGVTRMVELGGKVLGPMVKRIVPEIDNIAVQTPDDIDALLKAI
jgi:[acyl-carrier-protein] S-malonyltransferase